jgi:sulfoxide reductase heme-binding subunit YedZ
MNQNRAVLGLKVLLWIGALAPGAWMVGGIFQGWLGANPIERLTHASGLTALVLLLISLAITPLRRLTGWNPIIKLRRPIGLFAFFYALAHFSVWFVFDMNFDPSSMVADVLERKYITVGMTALLILVPIAVTSTKGWIRRLGKRWATLHRGVYVAAVLGVIHFYWLVKADLQLPLLLAACLTVLLLARVPRLAGALSRKRSGGVGGGAGGSVARTRVNGSTRTG